MERLIRHAAELRAAGVPVVLAGDYNVVPTDRDIYRTKSYADNALVQSQPRAQFKRLLEHGWTDAIRTQHAEPMYTFWDYLRNRWPRDAGLRLDHLLLSPEAAKLLVSSGVDRDARGKEGASDHAPAWIILKDRKPMPRKPPPAAKATTKGKAAKPDKRPLLVIDGDNFTHRSFHALPKTILGRGGKQAGAIVGFANFLLRLYLAEMPRAVLVAWDTLEAETYRHAAFAGYQSGREFDDALIDQLDALPEFVAACGFLNAKAPGYEADDFLAAAAAAEEKRGGVTLIASGDRDTFQLSSEHTTILYPLRAGEMARITPSEVRERYGVDPKLVPDFIALRGDPSDKLPGAAGIGAKTAAAILKQYGSLEAALKAGRFPNQAKDLRLYRSIATMDAKAPLPRLPDQTPTFDKAAALAKAWDLNKLAERLESLVAKT
jgi:DNA polymerase-1